MKQKCIHSERIDYAHKSYEQRIKICISKHRDLSEHEIRAEKRFTLRGMECVFLWNRHSYFQHFDTIYKILTSFPQRFLEYPVR